MKNLQFSNEGDDEVCFSQSNNLIHIEIRNHYSGGYKDIYLNNEEVNILIEFLKNHLETNDKN